MSATRHLKRNCPQTCLKTQLELEYMLSSRDIAPDLFDLLLENQDYQIEVMAPAQVKNKKIKGCNCSKSGCLKMYCQCFAKGQQCGPECSCLSCGNHHNHNVSHLDTDTSKPFDSPEKAKKLKKDMSVVRGQARKGCTCRKSGCEKRYCQCFANNLKCTEHCHCLNCNNCSHTDSTSGEMLPQF